MKRKKRQLSSSALIRHKATSDLLLLLLLFCLLPYLYQLPLQLINCYPLRWQPGQDTLVWSVRILHELLPLLLSGLLIGLLFSALSGTGKLYGLLVLLLAAIAFLPLFHCDICAVYFPGRSKLSRIYYGYGYWLIPATSFLATLLATKLLRWRRLPSDVHKHTTKVRWQADPRLLLSLTLTGYCFAAQSPMADWQNPRAVSSFECISLYWQTQQSVYGEPCTVHYRKGIFDAWKEALPLWFDRRNCEYRGSIVGLKANSKYRIRLQCSSQKVALTVRTRSEKPFIGRTYYLPGGTYDKTLLIRYGGLPGVYTLYCPLPGEKVVIDTQDQGEYGVEIAASHVIVRGFTVRNAHQDGIRLNGVHDVWIEDCDISDWGRADKKNPDFGRAMDAGIRCKAPNGRGFVIQHNRIHHPRYTSNNWMQELHPGEGNYHPSGPFAITWGENLGRHIIRNNQIFSDERHAFNDGIGGWRNFSRKGFPGADSDVYGNHISHCQDDALEIEGGGCNVRVWGNVLDQTMVGIASTACTVGPLYVFRNILLDSRWCAYPDDNSDAPAGAGTSFERINRGYFAKVGEAEHGGSGRQYWFHNTMLQRPPPPGRQLSLGAAHGMLSVGHTDMIRELVSLNNIWYVAHTQDNHFPERIVLRAGTDSETNIFDYDLYNGDLRQLHPGAEVHGWKSVPLFKDASREENAWLMLDSPGRDQGCVIPNFNDGFHGDGPDIGAVEAKDDAASI